MTDLSNLGIVFFMQFSSTALSTVMDPRIVFISNRTISQLIPNDIKSENVRERGRFGHKRIDRQTVRERERFGHKRIGRYPFQIK